MQSSSPAPHKFKPKRLHRILLCLLAVIGLGIWGKKYLSSPLPRNAYPVLSTARWSERSPQMILAPNYCWLPNGDLSYLKTSTRGLPQVCYQTMDSAGPVGSVRYGPELPPGPPYYSVAPSPDAQWIACIRMVSVTNYQTVVVSADGKTKGVFKELFVGWLSDNRSFLTASFVSVPFSLKVHHLDTTPIETIPLSEGWTHPFLLTRITNSPNFLISETFMQPTPGSDLTRNYPTLTMRTFQADKPGIVPQAWQVPVPPGTFGVASASPDNKHLFWITLTRKPALVDQWLHRLFPKRRVTFATHTDYFLSDLHGNHMHPILEGGPSRKSYFYPIWTPDSKHVSFVYNNQLYLVPVD